MTLWLVFAAIAVSFLLFLVVAVIFDGVLDMFDFGGDGVLSMTSIGGAGTGFGAGGALSVALFGADLPLAVLSGAVGALALGFVAMKIAKAMRSLEQEPVKQENKIGKIGYSLNSAEAGYAFEFMIEHNGVRKKTYAIADTDVASGEALEVEAILSSSRLKVKKQKEDSENKQNTADNSPKQIEQEINDSLGFSAEDILGENKKDTNT